MMSFLSSKILTRLKSIFSSNFMGDVFKLVSGTSLAQILIALATPILSRQYLPGYFGTAGLFISFVSIISIVASLRYDAAILLPEKKEDAANLLAASLILSVIVPLTASGLIYWQKAHIIDWLKAPELAPYLIYLPIAIASLGFFQALSVWVTREKNFTRLSAARVISTIATLILQIGLAFFIHSPTGLILGTAAGYAASAMVLGYLIWKDNGSQFIHSISLSGMVENLKKYRKFPLVDAWAQLLNAVSWQIPVLLLSRYFSQDVVGYYSMAYRLVQLPVSFISVALNQVFMQRASELKSEVQKLSFTTGEVFRKLILFGLMPSTLLLALGRDFFVLFLGSNWHEAGVYVQILGLWMFFWFAATPLNALTVVLERQEIGLYINILIFITRIISLVIGGIYHNVFLALLLFAVTGILAYSLLMIQTMRLVQYRISDIMGTFLRHSPPPILAAILLFILKGWLNPSPLWMILCGVIIALAYAYFVMKPEISKPLA